MIRTLLALTLALFAFAAAAAERQSFILMYGGSFITNGAPVNNKGIKARFDGEYFWFTRDGHEYLVRDQATLRRMRDVYAPLFDNMGDLGLGTFAEQMEVMREQLRIGLEPQPGEDPSVAARRLYLKKRQSDLAQRQNETARRMRENSPEKINVEIEKALAALSEELVRSGKAGILRK